MFSKMLSNIITDFSKSFLRSRDEASNYKCPKLNLRLISSVILGINT